MEKLTKEQQEYLLEDYYQSKLDVMAVCGYKVLDLINVSLDELTSINQSIGETLESINNKLD